jgi:hypothetical protein
VSPDGNKAKAKRNNRSVSYVDYATNKYIGAVSLIDQVLIDEWNMVVEALGADTTPEAEALELAEVNPIIEVLEDLDERRKQKPSAALDRLILAAEADLEEAKAKVEEAKRNTRLHGAVPDEIALLSIPEANTWVRRLIEKAWVAKEGRGKTAQIALTVRLKNGVQLALGDPTVGLRKTDEFQKVGNSGHPRTNNTRDIPSV